MFYLYGKKYLQTLKRSPEYFIAWVFPLFKYIISKYMYHRCHEEIKGISYWSLYHMKNVPYIALFLIKHSFSVHLSIALSNFEIYKIVHTTMYINQSSSAFFITLNVIYISLNSQCMIAYVLPFPSLLHVYKLPFIKIKLLFFTYMLVHWQRYFLLVNWL